MWNETHLGALEVVYNKLVLVNVALNDDVVNAVCNTSEPEKALVAMPLKLT